MKRIAPWLVVVAVLSIGAGYQAAMFRVQDEGTTIAGANAINFTGAGVSCTGSPVAACTISGGGSSGYATIDNEGTPLAQQTTLNFIGPNVNCVDDAGGAETDCTFTDAGITQAYTTVDDEGTPLTQQSTINFIGSSVTCVNDGAGSETDCTFTDAAGVTTVDNEGTPLTQRATINFIGAGVDCVDDAGGAETDCTISGGGGSDTKASKIGWNQSETNGRKVSHCQKAATNGTTFACNAATAPTFTCTGTAAANDQSQSGGAYISCGTTNSANNVAGHNSTGLLTRPSYRPIYRAVMRTDSTITTRRMWFGVSEATTLSTTEVRTQAAGAAASTLDFVALGFNTAVDASWMCCSGDGTNYSCTDTGVDVATTTRYTLTVDWDTQGSLDCTVNGTTVNKTTNLSTAAVNLASNNTITTLDGTIRTLFLTHFEIEDH